MEERQDSMEHKLAAERGEVKSAGVFDGAKAVTGAATISEAAAATATVFVSMLDSFCLSKLQIVCSRTGQILHRTIKKICFGSVAVFYLQH